MTVGRAELDRENSALQWEPAQRRRRRQRELLVDQARYLAEHSRFYRDRCAGLAGWPPTSPDDLDALPHTTKEELIAAQAETGPLGSLLCVPRDSLSRVCSTSGTTGRPLYYSITAHDKDILCLAWEVIYEAAGLTADDLAVFAFALGGPYGSAFGGEALERRGIPAVPVGAAASFERFKTLLVDLRPTAIVALTNFPVRLADKLTADGIDPAELGVRKIVVGGEPVAGYRKQIAETWQADVTEAMGIGELGMIWGECPHQTGMHDLTPAWTYVEYLDPGTGEFCSTPVAGETYELVYSSLNREAMPLLRYRSRDLVEVLTTDCPCGRDGAALRAIGRTDDMIKVRGVNVFPASIERLLADFGSPVTGQFQIVLPPDGARLFSTPLELRVACGPAGTPPPELPERLGSYLRAHLNVRTNVRLVDPSELADGFRGGLGRRDYFRVAEGPPGEPDAPSDGSAGGGTCS